MEPFNVVATFAFEAENVEEAGRDIRRLSEAAAAVGFDLRLAQVEPRSPDDPNAHRWATYAPIS